MRVPLYNLCNWIQSPSNILFKLNMLETEHYIMREAQLRDAEFILSLINQPAWKQFISDHSINTIELAQDYIENKLCSLYQSLGFGLWVVDSIEEGRSIGLCGLLKRDTLDCIDLGFGFLPEFWGSGAAQETSLACLTYAFDELRKDEVAAIVSPDNVRSIRLLEKLEFQSESDYFDPITDERLLLYKINKPQ